MTIVFMMLYIGTFSFAFAALGTSFDDGGNHASAYDDNHNDYKFVDEAYAFIFAQFRNMLGDY